MLRVKDATSSLQFYTEILGMELRTLFANLPALLLIAPLPQSTRWMGLISQSELLPFASGIRASRIVHLATRFVIRRGAFPAWILTDLIATDSYFLAFPVEGENLTKEEKKNTKLAREGVLGASFL